MRQFSSLLRTYVLHISSWVLRIRTDVIRFNQLGYDNGVDTLFDTSVLFISPEVSLLYRIIVCSWPRMGCCCSTRRYLDHSSMPAVISMAQAVQNLSSLESFSETQVYLHCNIWSTPAEHLFRRQSYSGFESASLLTGGMLSVCITKICLGLMINSGILWTSSSIVLGWLGRVRLLPSES